MAAYPTSPEGRTSISPINKARLQLAASGKIRSASLGEETAFRIKKTHDLITAAELATLQSWHDTNRYVDNTLVGNDALTYDCWVETDLQYEEVSGTYFNASITFLANRQ